MNKMPVGFYPATSAPEADKALRQYVCFYQQRRIELHAASSYDAQLKAAEAFNVKGMRRAAIAVVLADVPVDPASL